MTTYNQLEKEFKEKITELKKNCKHRDLSPWSIEWWALAHETGFEVRACKKCREIIKRRIACMDCGKVTEEYINGDGKRRPLGEYMCKECDKKEVKKLKLVKCEECTNAFYIKTEFKKSFRQRCLWCKRVTKHIICEKTK